MKPIFFNTEDVRATLDGRKTVTRRIVKGYIPIKAEFGYTFFTPPECISCRGTLEDKYGEKFFKLPYQPGDILYVRETWYYESHMEELTDGTPDLPSGRYSHRYIFKTDYPDYPVNVGVGKHGWYPSIHMPREAARLFLRVKSVRVERLQDMRLKDFLAEGVILTSIEKADCVKAPVRARERFFAVWNRTVKPADLPLYSWEANPWCWVIEFEKISKEEAEKRDR